MLRSFLDSANDPQGQFPLNNLPYAVCKPTADDSASVCIAIGAHVLNLSAAATHTPSLFPGPLLPAEKAGQVFAQPTLNAFLELGRPAWIEIRTAVTDALSENPANTVLKTASQVVKTTVLPLQDWVIFLLPLSIGDYTDFYSSISHARNVGTMFRGPENALPPNWTHMPIGYHGRASSVVLSGTPVTRPSGQVRSDDTEGPKDAPCKLLDFELEMATVVGGRANALGDRVSIDEAGDRIFGFTLMNDWSARDIQKWEYVPLGPFTAKNFATTISPFIVPMEALRSFRLPLPKQDPAPLPYLMPRNADRDHGVDVLGHCTFDVALRVKIAADGDKNASVVSQSNFKHLYWSPAQQIAHHSVTGCNLRAGDLLGSGTISGEDGT